MNIELVYIYPVNAGEVWTQNALRFILTYQQFPPGAEHSTLVVCNGGPPNSVCDLFHKLPNCRFFVHDNSGWDIGAYQAVANDTNCDMMLCCASASFFHKAGWLQRYVEAWQKFGPGLYANIACGPGRTHPTANPVRTVGFACPPSLIRAYPKKVVTRQDRYDFEHRSPNNITVQCLRMGLPLRFVTWDGFYSIGEYVNRVNNLII